MKFYKSIDRQSRKIAEKIKRRYLQGIKGGKQKSFYYNIRFYHLYLKRLCYLAISVLTLRVSTYKTFIKLISTKHLPHVTHPETIKNPNFRNFVRKLFGYCFLFPDKLYPVLPASLISKARTLDFVAYQTPVLSIIVYASENLSYTYNCLLAVKERTSISIRLEVIVIDDNKDTDNLYFFAKRNIKGIKYLHNTESIGFSRSINKAVSYANGEYICLLDCNTEVRDGWMEPLLKTIRNNASIAFVGSKLLLPDTSLDEAGGILDHNGNIQKFGNKGNHKEPMYNFIREVDYCSSGCVLFRKTDFKKAGMLDEQFSSSTYAIIDLCISFRTLLKKKVMYQPLSTIIQFENGSSIWEKVNSRIESDRILLCGKWKNSLNIYTKPTNNIPSYRRFISKSSIVFIEDSLLQFDHDERALRLFRILHAFKQLDYHLIFLPQADDISEPHYSALIEIGVEFRSELHNNSTDLQPVQTDYLNDVKLAWITEKEINQLDPHRFAFLKRAKIILDIQSCRTPTPDYDDLKKNLLIANKLSTYSKVDAVVTRSEDERKMFNKIGIEHIFTVPSIYHPVKRNNCNSFSQRSGIVFIGNYRYVENIDAAVWLITEIMPAIWEIIPDVPLYLLGNDAPYEITRFSNEKIVIPGYLQDVSAFFEKSRIAVAPLRYPSESSISISQALENNLPIISTAIGVKASSIKIGDNVLVADNLKSFCSQVLRVYRDQVLWDKLSANSYAALTPHSQQVVLKQLKTVLNSLVTSN